MIGINCGNPGEPSNGSVTFNDSLIGSVATYDCDFGFRLKGNVQRTCQQSGLWNGTAPRCERK